MLQFFFFKVSVLRLMIKHRNMVYLDDIKLTRCTLPCIDIDETSNMTIQCADLHPYHSWMKLAL